jgi:hypothetical protein
MTPTQLATVIALAMQTGVQAEDEETSYSFPVDEAVPGQKVVIHWRNRDRAAHFLGASDGKVLVLHGGNEVNMRPDLVRFPEDGEFPGVAENINQTMGV